MKTLLFEDPNNLSLQFSVLRADYTIVSVEGGGEFCATFNPSWGGKIPDHAVYVSHHKYLQVMEVEGSLW